MAIMEPNGEPDFQRVFALLQELSEQLNQNRSVSVNLHSASENIKSHAVQSQTGFVLRRFNLDKSKEVYDAELERMNASISAENQTLLNDNRQLSALIREYEQTLENVMAQFRTRALEVQNNELTLMHHYESMLIARETEAMTESLAATTARSERIGRIGRLLRAVVRRMGGEDLDAYDAFHSRRRTALPSESESPSDPEEEDEVERRRREKGKARETDPAAEEEEDDAEPVVLDLDLEPAEGEEAERRSAAAKWALERECELARLEAENTELRNLLNGLYRPPANDTQPPSASADANPAPLPVVEQPSGDPSHPATIPRAQRMQPLGGPPGTVGPFGTYRKR